jgi:type VII secretion-associated serine protease mycosin
VAAPVAALALAGCAAFEGPPRTTVVEDSAGYGVGSADARRPPGDRPGPGTTSAPGGRGDTGTGNAGTGNAGKGAGGRQGGPATAPATLIDEAATRRARADERGRARGAGGGSQPGATGTPGAPNGSGGASGAPENEAAWADQLRKRRKPAPAAVLNDAPTRGAVHLVTVREVDGRPVVSTLAAPDLAQARQAVTAATADPQVLDISLASTVRIMADDPYRGAQWGLTRLAAEQTWQHQRGNGVRVAVIDTGVDAGHPDLAGVVLPGRDFVATGNGQSDPHGHGTHVAGIIAAVAGNGIGVAGLAQGVKILPVRALGADGAGTDADVAKSVLWAVDQGAEVINMSVGSPDYSVAESAAVAYALQQGVLVVGATGNMRAQGNPAVYPASFPGVLGVGASGESDQATSFSGTGRAVDLLAPGVEIISTFPPSRYAYMDGTSMAAPFASAAAALVRAAAPQATPAQVTSLLIRTAKDIGPAGRDDVAGYGLVQPAAAIAAAQRLARTGVTPAPVTRPAPSTLAVVSAPSTLAYARTARLAFALSSNGKAVGGAPVVLCTATAPSTARRCRTLRTDSSGRLVTTAAVTGNLTVSARYAGSSAVAAATSRPVLIGALPTIRLVAGRGALTVTVRPAAAGSPIGLQRRVGSRWVPVTTRALPSSGSLTLRGLTRGTLYRVQVPATDRTVGAISGAVAAR